MRYLLFILLLNVASSTSGQEPQYYHYKQLADSCIKKADSIGDPVVGRNILDQAHEYLDTAKVYYVKWLKQMRQEAQLQMDIERLIFRPIDSTLFKKIDNYLKDIGKWSYL